MATSASDIILAIDRLTALRSRIAQFEKDGEILPGAAEIVRTEITQAIQVLIPF